MSNRAYIAFYPNKATPFSEPEVVIYRHSGGHPFDRHGVLAEMLPFLLKFHRRWRRAGMEYAEIQLQHPGDHYQRYTRDYYLGDYRVGHAFTEDVDYVYGVYGTSVVKVFEVKKSGADPDKDFVLKQTIVLSEKKKAKKLKK